MSNKIHAIFLIAILCSSVGVLLISVNPSLKIISASPSWWDANWSKRRVITTPIVSVNNPYENAFYTNGNEVSTSLTQPTEVYTWTSTKSGTLTFSFGLSADDPDDYSHYAAIFDNGAEVGNEYNTTDFASYTDFNTITEQISVGNTDIITLDLWGDGADSAYANSFAISGFVDNFTSVYQYKIIIPHSSSMRSDYGDLRFLENETTGILPYWIENYTSDNVTVWVKKTENTDNTIYAYYGNASATSTENGDNVFLFFDNFDTVNTNKWQGSTGNASVSSGILTFTAGGSWTWMFAKVGFNTNVAMLGSNFFEIPDDAKSDQWLLDDGTANVHSIAFWWHYLGSDNQLIMSYSGSGTIVSTTFHRGIWNTYKIRWLTDNTSFFDNGVQVSGSPITTNVPSITLYPEFCASSGTVQSDWIAVRSLVVSDPTTTVGAEESNISNVAPNIPINLLPSTMQTTTNVTIRCVDIDNDGDNITVYFYNNANKAEIGHTTIVSGGTASISWNSLTRGQTYTFFARGQDNNSNWSENSTTQSFYVSYIVTGSGTVGDPFVITNINELQDMKENLTAHYILGNDIDASATHTWNDNGDGGYYGFEPIGAEPDINNFKGTLDGKGYTISNLFINRITTSGVGLIGVVGSEGVIENVRIINENITCGVESGGLIGYVYGTVINCSVSGIVNSVREDIGGLVGGSEGIISNCYSSDSVASSGIGIGGFIGRNSGGTIINCYSTGNVSGGEEAIGGLIGVLDTGIVSACYSTGVVSGDSWVGGLIGEGEGDVSNSFWDNQTSGQSTSAGGTGKTTDNMKDVRTYTDTTWSIGLTTAWDFVGNPYNDSANENIWDIAYNKNNGYPFLRALGADITNTAPIVENIYIQDMDNTLDNNLNVDTYYKFKVQVQDNNNLSDIKSVQLNLYENLISSNASDNTRNHYTFEWKKEDWSNTPENYYVSPDPATLGNWESRTPVVYVAASNTADNDHVPNYICDGTNDENQIQTALKDVLNGGMVVLFNGTYNIASDIVFCDWISPNYPDNNVSLIGKTRDGVILKTSSSSSIDITVLLNRPTSQNILVENLTLISNGGLTNLHEWDAIAITKGNNIVIRNVTVENWAAIGIYVESASNYSVTNVWIENCYVENTGNQGIAFDSNHSGSHIENVYVFNNTINRAGVGAPSYLNGGHGISMFNGVTNAIIANNLVENCGQSGILLYRGIKNSLVQGNTVDNNANLISSTYGIRVSGTSDNRDNNITVKGNVVSQFYGITYDNTDNSFFLNNDVTGCTVGLTAGTNVNGNTIDASPPTAWIGSPSYILVENCIAGNYSLTEDNWTFVIKLSKIASPTNWDVWVQVIDNSNAQDNKTFVNAFSVNYFLSVSYSTSSISFNGIPNQTIGANENPVVETITSNGYYNVDVKVGNQTWTGGTISAEDIEVDKNGSAPYDITCSTTYQTLYLGEIWGEVIPLSFYWFASIPNGTMPNTFTNNLYIKVIQTG